VVIAQKLAAALGVTPYELACGRAPRLSGKPVVGAEGGNDTMGKQTDGAFEGKKDLLPIKFFNVQLKKQYRQEAKPFGHML